MGALPDVFWIYRFNLWTLDCMGDFVIDRYPGRRKIPAWCADTGGEANDSVKVIILNTWQ